MPGVAVAVPSECPQCSSVDEAVAVNEPAATVNEAVPEQPDALDTETL